MTNEKKYPLRFILLIITGALVAISCYAAIWSIRPMAISLSLFAITVAYCVYRQFKECNLTYKDFVKASYEKAENTRKPYAKVAFYLAPSMIMVGIMIVIADLIAMLII